MSAASVVRPRQFLNVVASLGRGQGLLGLCLEAVQSLALMALKLEGAAATISVVQGVERISDLSGQAQMMPRAAAAAAAAPSLLASS